MRREILSLLILSKGEDASDLYFRMARMDVPIPKPRLQRIFLEPRLCPWLKTSRKKFTQYRRRLLLTYPDFTLCQRSAMRRFHIARDFVIALSRGLPHEFSVPHELVPINAACPALPALFTFSFGIELALATL
jgi:hypothetical protein